MDPRIEHIKGLHPGVFLERELKKKGFAKGPFALSIGEYPQTISAIIHGKRRMNSSLAFRIEESLGLEKGTLMIIQVYQDIKQEEEKKIIKIKPDISELRASLFWDTDIEKIDWIKHRQYVIERVMERGTEKEKNMISEFYGLKSQPHLEPLNQ
jgi:plasmid maintenance system antidote protein VapI